jgi:Reverse transcriptase (RNA-dependent DNA polymerase)
MYLLVYVNDLFLISNTSKSALTCTNFLQQKFALKDLGPLNYFLGIEAHNSANDVHLLQTKYIKDLLSKTNMTQAKPCSTPMTTGSPLSIHDNEPFDEPHLYR